MSDATYFKTGLAARDDTRSLRLAKPQAFGAPVFIADAVTPLAGETILSLLWKRLEQDADAD